MIISIADQNGENKTDHPSASSRSMEQLLPVLSYSQYKKLSQLAGFDVREKPLVGKNARSLLTSTYFRTMSKTKTYIISQENLRLKNLIYTNNVVFPYMFFSEGLVVSDELYPKIKSVKQEVSTGYYTKQFEKTTGIANRLVENGSAYPNEKDPYSMIVSGTLFAHRMSMFKTMLFVALLIGTIFFVAAGSFLYFRLYSDLDYDRRQYLTIKKVGLTDQELNQIVTRQMALLFFVPIAVAFVHSAFAFMALQSFYVLSIAREMTMVLASFLIAQFIYFLIIRSRYMRNLKKSLI